MAQVFGRVCVLMLSLAALLLSVSGGSIRVAKYNLNPNPSSLTFVFLSPGLENPSSSLFIVAYWHRIVTLVPIVP